MTLDFAALRRPISTLYGGDCISSVWICLNAGLPVASFPTHTCVHGHSIRDIFSDNSLLFLQSLVDSGVFWSSGRAYPPGLFQPVSIRPGSAHLISDVHSSAAGEPDRRQGHPNSHLASVTYGAGPIVLLCLRRFIGCFFIGCLAQHLADLRQLLFSATIGEKSVVTNTH